MIDRTQETSFTPVDFGAFNELPLADNYTITRNCSGEVFILNVPYIPHGTITFDDKVTLPLAIKKPYFINFRKVTLNILAPFVYSASPFYIIGLSDRIVGVTFQKKEFYFDPCSQNDHFRLALYADPAALNELRFSRFNANSFAITPLYLTSVGTSIYSYVVNAVSDYIGYAAIQEHEKCIAWNMVEGSNLNIPYIRNERQQFKNSYEVPRIRRLYYERAHATDKIYFFIDFFDQPADESKNVHLWYYKEFNVPAGTTLKWYARSPILEGKSLSYSMATNNALQTGYVYVIYRELNNLRRIISGGTMGAVTTASSGENPLEGTPLIRSTMLTNAGAVSNVELAFALT